MRTKCVPTKRASFTQCDSRPTHGRKGLPLDIRSPARAARAVRMFASYESDESWGSRIPASRNSRKSLLKLGPSVVRVPCGNLLRQNHNSSKTGGLISRHFLPAVARSSSPTSAPSKRSTWPDSMTMCLFRSSPTNSKYSVYLSELYRKHFRTSITSEA